MKLRQRPEDFRVEELTAATGGDVGEFAFYRLEKTGWTTPDALAAIRRRWHVDFRRLGYGGLKDRHAVTTQYLTIFRGPARDLTLDRIRLTYLGRRTEPYSSADIQANRFVITIRGLNEPELDRAIDALAAVAHTGLANYFDDQRFGSVGGDGGFVARELVFGRFEQALKLALAAPYEFDRAAAKREKALLRAHWGDWATLKARLPRGHARSLVDYLLTHPNDFKGAVARLRPELQGLYLSAYQSHLWNRVLAAWLTRTLPPDHLGFVSLKLGRFPVPLRLPDELRTAWESLVLPLPTARWRPDPQTDWLPLIDEVLRAEGLTLDRLKIKGLHKPFFSKGERAACIRPAALSHEAGPDDLNPGRRRLTLRFELPRGSYATMLVKRLTAWEINT